jgi:hypothetical protein
LFAFSRCIAFKGRQRVTGTRWQAASIFCLLSASRQTVAAVMPLVIVATTDLVGRKQAIAFRRRILPRPFRALAVLRFCRRKSSGVGTSAGFGQQTISPWQYAAAQPAAIYATCS